MTGLELLDRLLELSEDELKLEVLVRKDADNFHSVVVGDDGAIWLIQYPKLSKSSQA